MVRCGRGAAATAITSPIIRVESFLPKVTVLIADDLKFFLEIEKSYLKRGGFDVLTAESGRRAVDLARQHRPNLILLDLEMPKMDGAQACVEMRKEASLASTPIIIMSASSKPETRDRCLKSGCTEFVAKPEKPDELLSMVARILSVKQRGAARLTVVFDVSGQKGASQVVGQVTNLSASGLLLETAQQVAEDATLDLQFYLPRTRYAVKTKGEVTRVTRTKNGGYQLGVRFISLSQADQEQILDFVAS